MNSKTFEFFGILNLDVITQYVHISASIQPGVIRVNRRDFGNIINAFPQPRWLVINPKPYVLHIPTTYGALPIIVSDTLKEGEIRIEPKVDIDEEFEKIVLDA